MYSPPPSPCWPSRKGVRTVVTRPPTRERASSTVTRKPARSSSYAATSPARPAPTTTTLPRSCGAPERQPTVSAMPAAAPAEMNRRRVNRGCLDVRRDERGEDDMVHVVLALRQRRTDRDLGPRRRRLTHERRELGHRCFRVADTLHVGVERLELRVESG